VKKRRTKKEEKLEGERLCGFKLEGPVVRLSASSVRVGWKISEAKAGQNRTGGEKRGVKKFGCVSSYNHWVDRTPSKLY